MVESPNFNVTPSLVQEHEIQAQGFVHVLRKTREELQERVRLPDNTLHLTGIPHIETYLELGILDEEEVVETAHQLLDGVTPVDQSSSSSPGGDNNPLYSVVLDVANYMLGKYQEEIPQTVIPLLKKIDIKSLSFENLRKVNEFMKHYGDPLPLFQDGDFHDIYWREYRNRGLETEGPRFQPFFHNEFLYYAALRGNQEQVLAFIKDKDMPSHFLNEFTRPLFVLANTGSQQEIFDMIKTKGAHLLFSFAYPLRACARNGLAEEVLSQIEADVLKKPYSLEYFSSVLADCASIGKPYADRVWKLLQASAPHLEKFGLCFPALINQGYSREIFDIILSPQFREKTITLICIPYCTAIDPSFMPIALSWLEKRVKRGEKILWGGLTESLAEQGQTAAVLDLLHYDHRHNPVDLYGTLKLCEEDGLGEQVREYIDMYVPSVTDASRVVFMREKRNFFKEIQTLLDVVGIGKNTKLTRELRHFVNTLSFQEFQFFTLLVKQNGIFHTNFLDFIDPATATRGANVFKTGSTLGVFNRDLTGVFVHQMPSQSAEIWKTLAQEPTDPLPTEPIVGVLQSRTGTETVVSRYCGLSFGTTLKLLGLGEQIDVFRGFWGQGIASDWATFKIIEFYQSHRNEFIRDIVGQGLSIVEKLEARGIDHGHLHMENFVIELIDAEYLENQLQQGQTINTLSYDSNQFTFDILCYDERKQNGQMRWKPIVRLIDFDQITWISQPQNTDETLVK